MPNPQALQSPQELLLVGAAVKTGLFTTLSAKALPVQELAAQINCDARAVWVVTEALISLGYLEKSNDLVRLTPEARDMFFNAQSPSFTGFAFMHGYELCRSWLALPDVMRTGEKTESRKRGPAELEYFMKAMNHYSRKIAPEITALCLEGMPPGAKVLDIGGGPLTYARAFAEHGAVVTILDLAEVVDIMSSDIKPGESIKMVPGNFTVAVPPGPFDLAYLGNICHIHGEKENRALFGRVIKELAPGGKIAILEFVRGAGSRAALFGVNMLVNTKTGGTWTLEEYTQWLQREGFSDVKMNNLGERQLITAYKAAVK